MRIFQKIIVILGLASASVGAAHAEDANERAIRNSQKVIEYLHSVPAPEIQRPLKAITEGSYRRSSPDQPMWIVEILSGTILYYQGQPEFANHPASRLIDDNGSRFGDRALSYGKASKSGWIRLALGGGSYQAFCKSQYPFVACTLAM